MARKPSNKPCLHGASGWWCATIGGRRKKLDRDYKIACRKLKALQVQAKRGDVTNRDWLDATFSELADAYLDDTQARKKPNTYQSFRYDILRALKILGTTLRVCEVRKFHLSKIEQELTRVGSSPSTIRNTLARVQAVFNWGVEHELLDSTPLAKYRKPRGRRRTRVITPDEYETLLSQADQNFRRVIIALRATGCRPGEVRTLLWQWVDLERGLWIIPQHKSVTQQTNPQPRIIPLPETIMAMCRELAQPPHTPEDHVFLNKKGKPYTKDCFVCKMDRLRKKAGIEVKAGERIVLYSNRHTYGTEKSARVSAIELAELMGHTDVRTTQRYTHFDTDRLHEIQRRAQGG